MKKAIILMSVITIFAAVGLTMPQTTSVLAKAVSAVPQATPEEPLDKDAADALVAELKEGLSDSVEDETSVTAITEKWDAHEDLAGKTKLQILKILFADVKSVVEDDETRAKIWKSWVGEEKSNVETAVEKPPAPPEKPAAATPPVNAPEKASTKDCPIRVGGMQIGTVKWFDNAKGYGFIKSADGKEVFVHHSNIESPGYRTLNEGEKVEFTLCISPGPKPNPRAIEVRRASDIVP